MSFDTCDQQIPDCGQDYVPIGKACFKSFPYTDPSCLQFNWIPYNSSYWQNNAIVDNVPVTECIRQCAVSANCDAAKYNFDNGSCELVYPNQNPNPILPKEKHSPNCIGLYKKSTKGFTGKNCASVNKKDGSVLTMHFDQYQPVNMVPIVGSDYQGVDCRKYASSHSLDVNKYKSGLQDFANWCAKNPDIDTCKSFCDNENYAPFCNTPFPKSMILYIFVFFMSLFAAIVVYTKEYSTSRKWKGVFGVCITSLIVFGALSIWKGVDFSKHAGRYSGTKPDFTNPSGLPRDCTQFRYDCKQLQGQSQCTVNAQQPDKAVFASLWDCQGSTCLKRVKYNTPYYLWGTNGKSFAGSRRPWCGKNDGDAFQIVDKSKGEQFIIVPRSGGQWDRDTKAEIHFGDDVSFVMGSDGDYFDSCDNVIQRTKQPYGQIVKFVNAGKAIDGTYVILDQSTFYIHSTDTDQKVGIDKISQQGWGLTWGFWGTPVVFNISENLPQV